MEEEEEDTRRVTNIQSGKSYGSDNMIEC